MTVPGQGIVVLQVYFKDGTLRTVKAGEADFRKATQRVYHTTRYPSAITFGVLAK